MKRKLIIGFILFFILAPVLFLYFQYFSRAAAVKARIDINVNDKLGQVPDRWKALAQGGEEKGRMLENVIPQVSGLYPRYIRIDHIYDYYDVVSRDPSGNLRFDWSKLDQTVCDIYHTGAKPFFSLGYMPPALSGDQSLVSAPKNWDEWSLLVQKTVERYSGKYTRLCGQVSGNWMSGIYYEVWNEPDLETFGKWSLYGGTKDYKTLYSYSVKGADQAKNVYPFLIGGPATTALYQSWIQKFLDYVSAHNLRIDFLSWHHYSKNPEDFVDDIVSLNKWLIPPQYAKYQHLPRIVSEWGYDSEPNPIADTNIGAAYTVTAIRNFFNAGFDLAFLFEIKDGPTPRWGILSDTGAEKPRYHALELLNLLEGRDLLVNGEGTYVKALASTTENKTVVVLVNYDKDNKDTELVPVTLSGLHSGSYTLNLHYLAGSDVTINGVQVKNGVFKRDILMQPNTVVALELTAQ